VTAIVTVLLGSLIDMSKPGHYVHWGFLQISLSNLIVVCLMVITFVAAIAVPYKRKARNRP
jgi:hypothetical protein